MNLPSTKMQSQRRGEEKKFWAEQFGKENSPDREFDFWMDCVWIENWLGTHL